MEIECWLDENEVELFRSMIADAVNNPKYDTVRVMRFKNHVGFNDSARFVLTDDELREADLD
jgi:hypothetical protein